MIYPLSRIIHIAWYMTSEFWDRGSGDVKVDNGRMSTMKIFCRANIVKKQLIFFWKQVMAAALLSYNSSDANHHISRLTLNLLSILNLYYWSGYLFQYFSHYIHDYVLDYYFWTYESHDIYNCILHVGLYIDIYWLYT